MVAARPFPPILFWALLVPAVMFAGGCVMRLQHSLSELAMVLFVVPMVMEAVAVPIAIVFLVRGYRTTANIILTLLGAIPALTLFGIWAAYNLSHIHF